MAEETQNTEEPQAAPEAAPEAPKESSTKPSGGTGLQPNVAAVLAYLFGWLGGLIFFLIEKDNKFVRFAAMQSILLNVAGIAFYFILTFGSVALGAITGGFGVLTLFLIPLFWIGYLIVWIMLMVKAYNNEQWELPVIGGIARNTVK